MRAVQRAQQQGNPGDSGAAVVVDVKTGRVLAMANYPTYDPSIWVGGVTQKQFEKLMDSGSLASNATQGIFAPGSTYKVVSTLAAGKQGFDLNGTYDCPSRVKLGTQVFRNYESAAYGDISPGPCSEVSCNTVFYGLADRMWSGPGDDAGRDGADPVADAARQLGLGEATGIDLPVESEGRIASREFKVENWERKRDTWCKNAVEGYPETRKSDPELADYFTALDQENCADGFRWREGDALNASIGQGDTAVTPLQMAMVYAAIANGGTVYEPRMVKAIMSADGNEIQDPTDRLQRDHRKRRPAIDSFPAAHVAWRHDRRLGSRPFLGLPPRSDPCGLENRFCAGDRRQGLDVVVRLVRSGR